MEGGGEGASRVGDIGPVSGFHMHHSTEYKLCIYVKTIAVSFSRDRGLRERAGVREGKLGG